MSRKESKKNVQRKFSATVASTSRWSDTRKMSRPIPLFPRSTTNFQGIFFLFWFLSLLPKLHFPDNWTRGACLQLIKEFQTQWMWKPFRLLSHNFSRVNPDVIKKFERFTRKKRQHYMPFVNSVPPMCVFFFFENRQKKFHIVSNNQLKQTGHFPPTGTCIFKIHAGTEFHNHLPSKVVKTYFSRISFGMLWSSLAWLSMNRNAKKVMETNAVTNFHFVGKCFHSKGGRTWCLCLVSQFKLTLSKPILHFDHLLRQCLHSSWLLMKEINKQTNRCRMITMITFVFLQCQSDLIIVVQDLFVSFSNLFTIDKCSIGTCVIQKYVAPCTCTFLKCWQKTTFVYVQRKENLVLAELNPYVDCGAVLRGRGGGYCWVPRPSSALKRTSNGRRYALRLISRFLLSFWVNTRVSFVEGGGVKEGIF